MNISIFPPTILKSTWAMCSSMMMCLLLGLACLAYSNPLTPPPKVNPDLAAIQTPNGFMISAELADTPDKRSKGLMYRTRLAPDRGMLFTFTEPGYWTFWMKNTKMALDMIWIDQKGTIVHIEHNVPICERTDNLCPRYRPKNPAMSVLELRAGQAKTLELKTGDKLMIKYP